MRKLFISFVFAVVGLVSINAQDLKFFNIDEVKQLSETQFMVISGAQTLRVNPDVFVQVAKNKTDYLLVTYKDAKMQTITVARKSNITYMVLKVDSVGIAKNGNTLVFLSSGAVYESPNEAWRGVRTGQKVEGAFVDGETKVIRRKWHTVPRESAITTEIPISPAPATAVIVMDEENKVVRTATAPVSLAVTPVNNGDDDDSELMTDYPKREAAAAAAAEAAQVKKNQPTTTSQPTQRTVRIVRTSN